MAGNVHLKGVGANAKIAKIDTTDEYLVTMNEIHALIHEGLVYSAFYHAEAVIDNGDIELLLTTAASRPVHLILDAMFTGDALLQIFEGTTVSANGTVLTPTNRNRTSSNTATMTVHHTPTVTGDGTALLNGGQFLPSGSGPIKLGVLDNEIILAANTLHLVRLQNIAGAAADLGVALNFYEPQ